jgi:hypothetical protein
MCNLDFVTCHLNLSVPKNGLAHEYLFFLKSRSITIYRKSRSQRLTLMDKKERRPSDVNIGFNPLEDLHFADTIQDFLSLYSPTELQAEPFIQTYLIELLARWGRWYSRGRAPALCFEAACVGGLSFLNKTNREPTELTARADASLARILAGLVIDEVEPMARQQGGAVRDKAVGIVADEFLARAVSPRVAKVGIIDYSLQKLE